ncbi:hypothetical protein ACQKEK_02415 [Pseudomonas sp. NPDC077408]|uniref:hypothetical protein n=1 Tax=Streptomyces parvus TaxID=66428 RepID=UPI00372425AF
MNGHIIRNTGSAVTVEMPSGERVEAPSVVAALDMVEQSRSLQKEGFGQINTIDCRDPRTVEWPDVAFDAERHLYFAPECQHRYRFDYEFPSQEGPPGKVFQCEDCGRIKVGGDDE